MAFTLDVASEADVPALNALIERSARELSRGFYTEAQVEAAVRYVFGVDTNLVRDGTYFVVREGDALAGCGGWSGEGLDAAVDAAKIRAFFVAPEFARRGVGRMLVEACVEAAGREGFAFLELMATLPGVPLYAACGFVGVRDVLDTLPDGTAIEFVLMRRRIVT